jgi:hypothetical protein
MEYYFVFESILVIIFTLFTYCGWSVRRGDEKKSEDNTGAFVASTEFQVNKLSVKR